MTERLLSQVRRLKPFLPKRLGKYHWLVLFITIIIFGVVIFAQPAAAADLFTSFFNVLARFFIWVMLIVANLCIGLTVFFLRFFISIASYNNYIDVDVVQLGWTMVRDVANMFFVVALLIIAFGTILGLEEYEWKKNLVKLILAAILINFSNLIAQLIIDVAHVFTITFLNAISATAGGNLINMFKLDQITKMVGADPSAGWLDGGSLQLELLAGAMAASVFAILSAVAMGSYVVVMMARVVALWALIILSPIAFILGVLPKTKSYADKWWSEFGKHVVVAPIMVFFLWLSFATLGTGQTIQDIKAKDSSVIPLQEEGFAYESDVLQKAGAVSGQNKLSLSEVTTWENMANFLIAIAFMAYGLKATQETGATASGLVGKAADFGKKVATIATGYAAGRWLVGKGTEGGKSIMKGAAMNVPIVGGKSWVRRGKKIAAVARIGYSKVNQWRDRGAKSLEDKSKKLSMYTIERKQKLAELEAKYGAHKLTEEEYKKGKIDAQADYEKKVKEAGISTGTVGTVGRFASRLLAGAIESGGRSDKRAENWETAAETEKKITEAEYSLSWTKGGQIKVSGKARLELEERKQEAKSKQKVEAFVQFLTDQDKIKYQGAQETIREHQDAEAAEEAAKKERNDSDQKLASARGFAAAVADPATLAAEALRFQKENTSRLNDLPGEIKQAEKVFSVKEEEAENKKLKFESNRNSIAQLEKDLENAKRKETVVMSQERRPDGTFDVEAIRAAQTARETIETNLAKFKQDGQVIESNYKQVESEEALAKTELDKKQQELIDRKKKQEFSDTEWGAEVKSQADANVKEAKTKQQLAGSKVEEAENKRTALAKDKPIAEAQKQLNEVKKRGLAYSTVMAEQKLKETSAGKAQAAAELEAAYMEFEGEKLIKAINLAEQGKKAAEEFLKTLKNKDLEKQFNRSAEQMKKIITIGLEKGAKEMEEALKRASQADVYIRAMGAAQIAKTSEEAVGIRRRQAEDAANDAFIGLPRYGTTSASSALSDYSESKMKNYKRLERTAAMKKATEVMAQLMHQKEQGKDLEIDQEAELFAASSFLNDNAWNDDQHGFIQGQFKRLQSGELKGEEEARWKSMAKNFQKLGWLNADFIKDGEVNKNSNVNMTYSRKHAADLQALGMTGNDVELLQVHHRTLGKQRENDIAVTQAVEAARVEKITELEKRFAQEEKVIDATKELKAAEEQFGGLTVASSADDRLTASNLISEAKQGLEKVLVALDEAKNNELQTAMDEAAKRTKKDYFAIADQLLKTEIGLQSITSMRSSSDLKARYDRYTDFMQDATKSNRQSALNNGHTQLGFNQDFDEDNNTYRFQGYGEAESKMRAERVKYKKGQLITGDQYHSFGDLDQETGIIDRFNTQALSVSVGGAREAYEVKDMPERSAKGLAFLHKDETARVEAGASGIDFAVLGGAKMRRKLEREGKRDPNSRKKHMLASGVLPALLAGPIGWALVLRKVYGHTSEIDAERGMINLKIEDEEIPDVQSAARTIIKQLDQDENFLSSNNPELASQESTIRNKLQQIAGAHYEGHAKKERSRARRTEE